MKRLMRIGLVLAVGLILQACQEHGQPFRIAFNTWVGYGPLYIAQDQGLFDELGVNVELIRMEGTGERRAAMIGGRVEALGSTIDDFVVGLSQGLDAKMVLVADESLGADGIIAQQGISSLHDLLGKRIAVQPGFVNHFFLLYLLDTIDADPHAFQLIPMEPDKAAAALFTGDVDVAVTWEPHLSVARQKKDFSLVLTTRDPIAQHVILDNLIVDSEVLRTRRSDVEAVVKAWFMAVDLLNSNPQVAYEILAAHFDLPQEDVRDILTGVNFPNVAENLTLLDRGGERNVYQLAEKAAYLYKEAGFIDDATSIPSFEAQVDVALVDGIAGQ